LIALAFSIIGLFIWIPLDVETGYLEKVRRSVALGDSLAPAVAMAVIALGGILLLIESRSQTTASPSDSKQLSFHQHGVYAVKLFLVFVVFVVLVRYTGPLLVNLWPDIEGPYRLLRDTVPWKYAGFILSGVFFITLVSSWTTHGFRWRYIVVALLICAVIISLYDLPFDDLLLPPNGDV